MTQDADIIIAGGGLNGPALALALAQAGLRITMIDAQPAATRQDDRFDGRAYALALASVRLLGALGVWAAIADRAQPILQVKACDGQVGHGVAPWFLHFDHAEIEEGPLGHMVEDRFLRRALMDAVDDSPQITALSGQRIVAQDTDGPHATVTLADGSALSAGLIVGCDGRQSGTASRAGIRRMGWGYGQTALVATLDHEHPHDDTAHQLFLPAGPLAILPLPGNRSSIVWSEKDAAARKIAALDDAAFLAALRPRLGDFLGPVALVGDRFSYPLSLSLANSFIAPRLALAGDAAHGIHPIAGQGLNLGLRDIAALAETLVLAHRRGEDLGSTGVLQRYQSWRRFDTATLALATDGFNRLFSNDIAPLRGLRDIGMGLVNALPPLRRTLMREAAGLQGDLPRLMTGKPL